MGRVEHEFIFLKSHSHLVSLIVKQIFPPSKKKKPSDGEGHQATQLDVICGVYIQFLGLLVFNLEHVGTHIITHIHHYIHLNNMTNFGELGSGILKTDISVKISKLQNLA